MLSNQEFHLLVSKYSKLLTDEIFCLEQIKKITEDNLISLKKNYESELDRKIQPVNLLRLIIINQLLTNKSNLTLDFIKEAKINIKEHEMNSYSEIKNEWKLNLKQLRKKNYFHSWNTLGKICYRLFFFGSEKEEVNKYLNLFVETLKPICGENTQANIVDFNGSSNFGGTRCWVSFYPGDLDSHRDAIQLFLSFRDQKIEFGIYKGSDVEIDMELVKQMFTTDYDDKSLEIIKQKFFELKNRWTELNKQYANRSENGERKKRFWKCGFGEHEILKDFISTNRWYIQYEREDENKAAIEAYDRFDSVKIGDEIAIAGLGRNDNLTVHYIGEVTSIEDDELVLNKLERKLYHGKAPRFGKTNYQTTITEIKNKNDIDLLFFGKNLLEVANMTKKEMSPKGLKELLPQVNMIFFGPPGTGKTHFMQEIINNHFSDKQNAELNLDKIEELKWWQAIALVLEDMKKPLSPSEVYNHQIIKRKAALTNSKSVNATICGKLQGHSDPETSKLKWSGKNSPFIFDYNDGLYTLKKDWREISGYVDNNSTSEKRYELITFHQSYSYEDFIEGIRPILNDEISDEISYEKTIGKFLSICNKARLNPTIPYAILIDEINRGNVSQIFGELITLIESSKRENTFCSLTYTKDAQFTVPKNLYIIGTMNTADKSIAPLDFALRRRFHFKAFWPDVKEIKSNFNVPGLDTELFCNFFTEFNEKIEILKGKDYTLGHAYFMHIKSAEELYQKFYDQVIPLMQEYFYDDHEALQFLFTENFYQKNNISEKFKNIPDSRREVYSFLDFKENDGINFSKFIEAINKSVLKKESDKIKEAA